MFPSMVPLLVAGIGFFCLGGLDGLLFDIVPDDVLYACVGGKVTFPWNFKLAQNDTVLRVSWIRDSAASSTPVAAMVYKHFLVASLDYSGRVKDVGNGGLTLDDLASSDSGNYTIRIKATVNGVYRLFQNTVYLQVGDGLMLKGGKLTAAQDEAAWWSEDSRRWFLRLTCGAFSYLGKPPFDVVWTLPDGQTRPSTGYDSGLFYLALALPVQGGNYSCSIPLHRLPDLCYRESSVGMVAAVALSSSHVTVDELQVRLSTMETNQKTLRQVNARMQERVEILEQTHQDNLDNLTQCCQNTLVVLQDQMDQVESDQLAMKEKVEALVNITMAGPCSADKHNTINDAWRSTSEGEGRLHCDNGMTPGWYRFYLHGANAIIPTSCVPESRCQTHASTWLDLQGKPIPAMGKEVAARACSHWSSDCCKWQVPITIRNCGSFFVYNILPVKNCQLAFCVDPQK